MAGLKKCSGKAVHYVALDPLVASPAHQRRLMNPLLCQWHNQPWFLHQLSRPDSEHGKGHVVGAKNWPHNCFRRLFGTSSGGRLPAQSHSSSPAECRWHPGPALRGHLP